VRRARERFTPGDKGSVLILLPILAVGMFLMLGVIIDGAGRVKALQRAHTVAGQAARQAGQQIDGGAFQLEGRTQVNPTASVAQARSFLRRSDMRGTVSVNESRTRITVTATNSYRPVFLSFFGFGPVDLTGSAQAQLLRVNP
jgi:hypothetical protein